MSFHSLKYNLSSQEKKQRSKSASIKSSDSIPSLSSPSSKWPDIFTAQPQKPTFSQFENQENHMLGKENMKLINKGVIK